MSLRLLLAALLAASITPACAGPAPSGRPSPAEPIAPAEPGMADDPGAPGPVIVVNGVPAPPRGPRLQPLDADARAWVDSTLASLDLRRKVAQMVVAWTGGAYMPVPSPEYYRLRDWVRELGVGGIIHSIGPPLELADRLNRLQRLADIPLLIATDLEHGPAQRLTAGVLLPWGSDLGSGTTFPPVMGIGATGNPEWAYELGRITATEARAVGIHVALAPVVDVNNNPANPVINTRSYGEDPAAVGRFGVAHLRGLQEHGVLAVAKHFPGHGDVSEDTHLVPLILRISAARADSVELRPFRAAIGAGVSGVMSAHIAVPSLTGDTAVPATLSARMLDSLLVRELGHDGLVWTDALNMGALVAKYGPETIAVGAVTAGADVLLQPTDPRVAVNAVVAAVEDGRITEARIEASVRKILEAKARLGLHRERTVDLDEVAERVGITSHRSVAERVAEASITLVRDRAGLVPLRPARDRRVLSIAYTDDIDPFVGRAFHATLAQGLPGLGTAILGSGEHPAVLDSVFGRADSAGLVLFVSEVRTRASKGSVAIEPAVAERLRELATRRPVILVSLGNPYVLQQAPDVGTYLLGWGGAAVSQRAAARALLGEIPITGRLPISIPPLHGAGEGIDRGARELPGPTRDTAGDPPGDPPGDPSGDPSAVPGMAAAEAAIRAAIAERVTPGAAVAIGGSRGTALLAGYGAIDYAAGAPDATARTLYDLASLTKVVATMSALMILVERGLVELDAPLSRYLHAWPSGGWRDSVTVRRLLTHRAGLPAFVRFWHPSQGALRGKEAIVKAIAALEPAYRPGEREVYSDLGFILLGAAVEAATGEALDRFLHRELWTPLGMDDTGFAPAAPPGRVAPTEVDTVFRHTHVHGVVHDENAYAIGGVAGHAGLFSTAADLARFARWMLRLARGQEAGIVSPATVARFLRGDPAPGHDRVLGWDRAPGPGEIAAALSRTAFGHTGFTGTGLWIDPERDRFVVLLTNRVNPTREGPSVTPLRRAVIEAAVR